MKPLSESGFSGFKDEQDENQKQNLLDRGSTPCRDDKQNYWMTSLCYADSGCSSMASTWPRYLSATEHHIAVQMPQHLRNFCEMPQ